MPNQPDTPPEVAPAFAAVRRVDHPLLVALVSTPAAPAVTALVAGFLARPPRWTGGSS